MTYNEFSIKVKKCPFSDVWIAVLSSCYDDKANIDTQKSVLYESFFDKDFNQLWEKVSDFIEENSKLFKEV